MKAKTILLHCRGAHPLSVVAFIVTALVATALSSCSIESSDNGDLDGYWHLERIDTIATAGVNDLSEQRLFWSVNNKLLMLRGDTISYFMRFRQTADSLVVFSPYLNGGHEDIEGGGDHLINNPALLHPYGIGRLEEHFVVFQKILKHSYYDKEYLIRHGRRGVRTGLC